MLEINAKPLKIIKVENNNMLNIFKCNLISYITEPANMLRKKSNNTYWITAESEAFLSLKDPFEVWIYQQVKKERFGIWRRQEDKFIYIRNIEHSKDQPFIGKTEQKNLMFESVGDNKCRRSAFAEIM